VLGDEHGGADRHPIRLIHEALLERNGDKEGVNSLRLRSSLA
jgi:hypothetical protein